VISAKVTLCGACTARRCVYAKASEKKSHPSAAQFAMTDSQNTIRNDRLLVLWRNTCRATSPPGHPPARSTRCRVASEVRDRPSRAADPAGSGPSVSCWARGVVGAAYLRPARSDRRSTASVAVSSASAPTGALPLLPDLKGDGVAQRVVREVERVADHMRIDAEQGRVLQPEDDAESRLDPAQIEHARHRIAHLRMPAREYHLQQ
jgi:hypothetical protein